MIRWLSCEFIGRVYIFILVVTVSSPQLLSRFPPRLVLRLSLCCSPCVFHTPKMISAGARCPFKHRCLRAGGGEWVDICPPLPHKLDPRHHVSLMYAVSHTGVISDRLLGAYFLCRLFRVYLYSSFFVLLKFLLYAIWTTSLTSVSITDYILSLPIFFVASCRIALNLLLLAYASLTAYGHEPIDLPIHWILLDQLRV